MANNKTRINSQLNSINVNNTFTDRTAKASSQAEKGKLGTDATLFGNGNAGEKISGFEALENKINGAGTALGDSISSFTDEVEQLVGLVDPSSIAGEVSSLTGLSMSKQVKLAVETLQGTTIKAIDEAEKAFKDVVSDITSAVDQAASVSATGSGGGAFPGSPSLSSLEDVLSKVSSIPSINSDAPLLDNVKDITSELLSKPRQLFNDVETGVDKLVSEATNKLSGFLSEVESTAQQLFDNTIGQAIETGQGFIQDVAESLSRQASSLITSITNAVPFSDNQLSNIIRDAQSGVGQKVAKAVQSVTQNTKFLTNENKKVINSIAQPGDTTELISQYQNRAIANRIDPREISATVQRFTGVENRLSRIDTTISGTIIKSAEDFAVEEVDLQEVIRRYRGARSTFDAFTYIDSKEELGAEIRNITRPINEIVVHASETYTNQNIGAEEIQLDNTERGFDGIQYHYVIRRDGRLQRGRPADKIGEASAIRGHNTYCIDVCLIGGVNVPTGTDNPLEYLSSQSFTIAQMKTLEALFEAFYRRYPGGQTIGHNDIDFEAQDPYFDVIAYTESKFRKKSVYNDLLTEQALSDSELITKRPV